MDGGRRETLLLAHRERLARLRILMGQWDSAILERNLSVPDSQ